jgi:hypothetical protein
MYSWFKRERRRSHRIKKQIASYFDVVHVDVSNKQYIGKDNVKITIVLSITVGSKMVSMANLGL